MVDNDSCYLANSMTASIHHPASFYVRRTVVWVAPAFSSSTAAFWSSTQNQIFFNTPPLFLTCIFFMKKNFFETPTVRKKKKIEEVKMKSHFFSASIFNVVAVGHFLSWKCVPWSIQLLVKVVISCFCNCSEKINGFRHGRIIAVTGYMNLRSEVTVQVQSWEQGCSFACKLLTLAYLTAE